MIQSKHTPGPWIVQYDRSRNEYMVVNQDTGWSCGQPSKEAAEALAARRNAGDRS